MCVIHTPNDLKRDKVTFKAADEDLLPLHCDYDTLCSSVSQ